MNKLEQIFEKYQDYTFLKADGFDEAVIGVYDDSFGSGELKLVYSTSKCIEILMRDHEMEYDIAVEYFQYNTLGAFVGKKTPILCDDEF